MSENTRRGEDGFKGEYPRNDDSWAEDAFRAAGMEPPWTLEYRDGKVVGPAKRSDHEAPRHEA